MASTSSNNTADIQTIKNDLDIKNYEKLDDPRLVLTRWVFTWNNYTEEDIKKLNQFGHDYCKYLIYGKETAPTTGTKHLQGYIHLLRRKTLQNLKGLLGKQPSFFKARKSDLANYNYCSKQDNFYFYECSLGGTNTNRSKENFETNNKKKATMQERLETAWELAKEEKYLSIDKDILIKHGKELKRAKMEWEYQPPENLFYDQGEHNYFKCHNLWLWGETGTGKSFFITYLITGLNEWWKRRCELYHQEYTPLRVFNHQKTKWWCGYVGEEIVVINEVNPLFCSWYAAEIKEWVDQYPFNAEVKGSNLGKIRPLFFIFTSNYPMEQCFVKTKGRDIILDENNKPIINKEDLLPMKRRMMSIHRSNKDKNTIIYWPDYQELNEYHNNLDKYKQNMERIKLTYINEVVNYQNHTNKIKYCDICGETQYECKCFSEDHEKYCHICKSENNNGNCSCGRLKYILNKYKNTETINQITETPKLNTNNKIITNIKINKINNTTPTKRSIDHIIIPSTPIKKSRLSLKNKGKQPALDLSISPIPLERSNAFIDEPPTSLPFPSTPTFKPLNLSDNEETNYNEEINDNKENSIKIPQLDGANDDTTNTNIKKTPTKKHYKLPFTNSNGRTYISIKQHDLIESKISYIQNTINPQIKKIIGDMNKPTQSIFGILPLKTKLENLQIKKKNIIKKYNLTNWNWIDDTEYKDPKKCWYCNAGIINQCACDGTWKYIDPNDNREYHDSENEDDDHDFDRYQEQDKQDYEY